MNMHRALGAIEEGMESAISTVFDALLKRHPDERVFWNSLFDEKLRIFEATGRTDWDVPSSQNYYKLLLGDFRSRIGTPATALEMGCGTAVLSMLLAAGGCNATIVDRSAAALEYARVIEARLRKEFTFLGRTTYIHSDFMSLDRSLRSEVAHNCGVIEEMPTAAAVAVVQAMSAHAGRQVVVGVPNFFNPYLLDIWRRGGKGTERYFSRRTLARVLRMAGLQDSVVFTSSCVHPLLPHAVNRGLGLGFLHLGVAYT